MQRIRNPTYNETVQRMLIIEERRRKTMNVAGECRFISASTFKGKKSRIFMPASSWMRTVMNFLHCLHQKNCLQSLRACRSVLL